MFFGLPWFAIVAIVGILIPLGGMFYAFKEKELEMEEKRLGSSREIKELRKVVHNLKSRVENLETIAAEEKNIDNKGTSVPLGEIEFDEEESGAQGGNNASKSGSKIKN